MLQGRKSVAVIAHFEVNRLLAGPNTLAKVFPEFDTMDIGFTVNLCVYPANLDVFNVREVQVPQNEKDAIRRIHSTCIAELQRTGTVSHCAYVEYIEGSGVCRSYTRVVVRAAPVAPLKSSSFRPASMSGSRNVPYPASTDVVDHVINHYNMSGPDGWFEPKTGAIKKLKSTVEKIMIRRVV